jgi:uncharacterized OB-fold protein
MSRLMKAITIAFLVSMNVGLIRAADPTHHFKLMKPAKVTAGDKVELTVSAHRKDGSVINDATNTVTLSITTRQGTETHKMQLAGGKASITVLFDKPGSHLIWVQDNDNKDLNMSDSVKVNYKLEVLR